MASRNGLNPKIRGLKGVGFNRALPAPFGFGNGIKPDGNNDYMTVPRLSNFILPDKFTIEFWLYKNTANTGYMFSLYDDLKGATLNFTTEGNIRLLRFDSEHDGLVGQTNWQSSDDGQKAHCVWCLDKVGGTANFYLNGYLIDIRTSIAPYIPDYINLIYFFKYRNGGLVSNVLIDEFRLYSNILRADQIALNYNEGIGNNPIETEYLLLWYQFESFENLDFSAGQDGSDIRFGVRDYSGNNNHGAPINMDTNSTSPTYVLKTF